MDLVLGIVDRRTIKCFLKFVEVYCFPNSRVVADDLPICTLKCDSRIFNCSVINVCIIKLQDTRKVFTIKHKKVDAVCKVDTTCFILTKKRTNMRETTFLSTFFNHLSHFLLTITTITLQDEVYHKVLMFPLSLLH